MPIPAEDLAAGLVWHQVDTGRLVQVSGLALQGHPTRDEHVSQFSVRTSADGINWQAVDSGREFNVGSPHLSMALFRQSPVTARYVRVYVHAVVGNLTMRTGIIICDETPQVDPVYIGPFGLIGTYNRSMAQLFCEELGARLPSIQVSGDSSSPTVNRDLVRLADILDESMWIGSVPGPFDNPDCNASSFEEADTRLDSCVSTTTGCVLSNFRSYPATAGFPYAFLSYGHVLLTYIPRQTCCSVPLAASSPGA